MRSAGKKLRAGIEIRLVAYMTLVVLLISACIAGLLIYTTYVTSSRNLVNDGWYTARMLAQNGAFAIYTEEEEALTNLLGTIDSNPRLVYASILDENGRPIASKKKVTILTIPAPALPHGSDPGESMSGLETLIEEGGHQYLDFVTPIYSPIGTGLLGDPLLGGGVDGEEAIGFIQLGVTRDFLQDRFQRFLTTTVSLTLVIILVGFGVSVLLAQRIVLPIRKLHSATRRFTEGDLETQVEVRSGDEIGEFADAFNTMLTQINSSHEELETRASELAEANERLNTEIEDRTAAEEALRQSEERYAIAARAANDGLWDWNVKSDTVYYSPRWKSMLGLADEEVGNRLEDWFGRIHEKDRIRLKTGVQAVLDGSNDDIVSEYRILHANGLYLWVLSRGAAIRDDMGRTLRIAGSQTDITARKSAEQQLIHEALHDGLTKLPNRTLIMDRLGQAIKRSKRRDSAGYAVIFMDLDRFKVINDSLGHLVGDQLLIQIARRIKESVRPGDTAARLGGDEFAILVEDIEGPAEVSPVVDRIKGGMEQVFRIEGNEIHISGSMGIAYGGPKYDKPEELLRDADIAMYRAKEGNKGFEVFDEDMHCLAVERMRIETDLRRAVEQEEFLLHFQPVVSLVTRKLVGFEALLRWMHPERGLLLPDQFLKVAEETRLILPMNLWILKEAFTRMQGWISSFPISPELMLSVNLSSREFTQPDLLDRLKKSLNESGLNPKQVAVEVNEGTIMVDPDAATETLSSLRELGIKTYVDDFGTGYASLTYLAKIPLDRLKVDRIFVGKIDRDKSYHGIVRSIVTLARELGREVVAEGIETEEQFLILKELGCELGQGWLFSEPLPPERVEEMLENPDFRDRSLPFDIPGHLGD